MKKQLELINLRNRLDAFNGKLIMKNTDKTKLDLTWKLKNDFARLEVNLSSLHFSISYTENGKLNTQVFNT